MEELAAPTLSTLAPTRRQILESLKKRGELSADELAGQLQLTTSGVRQHLVALTSDATWFYNFSTQGDIINIVGSSRGPSASDAGTADWNMSWDKWVEPVA